MFRHYSTSVLSLGIENPPSVRAHLIAAFVNKIGGIHRNPNYCEIIAQQSFHSKQKKGGLAKFFLDKHFHINFFLLFGNKFDNKKI